MSIRNQLAFLGKSWADKMWSSYVQLNPGTYSDAVATEFKRRMQPDYVENLVPNGGGLNATDWLGAVGGIAQGWVAANATPSIVTGNGFTGNAQRIVSTVNGSAYINLTQYSPLPIGSVYSVTLKYRASAAFGFKNFSGVEYFSLPTNTGNAVNISTTITSTNERWYIGRIGASIGDWIEIDEVTITPIVSQNYFTTFGPSGLNKTTADWIGIMVTSSATVVTANTKTGAVMKWNLDGTIVTQNNLPAYTNGANAGIITFTSTDGFGGVTTFYCNTCNLNHLSGLSGFTNLVNFRCYSNKLTSLANTGTNKISADDENGNYYTTAMVDSRLAYYNTMFAATPPIKNFILNLSGATMGIPTGAGNNPDYLGIIAKVQAAGFVPQVTIRTA